MNELNLDLTPEQQKLADEVLAEVEEKLKQIEKSGDENIADFGLSEISKIWSQLQNNFSLDFSLEEN